MTEGTDINNEAASSNHLPLQWLGIKEMKEILCMSKTSIYNLVKNDATFPKPISLGRKMSRWVAEDVRAWQDTKSRKQENE